MCPQLSFDTQKDQNMMLALMVVDLVTFLVSGLVVLLLMGRFMIDSIVLSS